MKSLEQIYILNYLSDEVWRAVTGLLDVVERFDLYDKADSEVEKDFCWTDAVGQLEMWRTLMGDHSKEWEKSLNEIDLEEVNIELLDDCPDNSTLQNRLRIVKNRYFGTWEITKAGEKDVVFNKLLHIVDRLTEILFSVYDWGKDDAHRKAVKWHDYLLQKWCNVGQLQNYMQSVIDNAESILNPQPDTTELPPIFQQYDIFKDNASVAKVFVSLIDEGLIKIDGNLFRWLDDRNSLCYFCYSLNLHYDLNTKNNNVPWVSFKNMFLCKIWDKWVEQTNNDLRDNWQQYLKNAKSEYNPNGEQGKILPPRGKQKIWEKIENAML